MIYLDNNASTPVDPEVSDAIFSSLKRDFGNPSSSHLSGRRAREVVETSRRHISDLLECSEKEIYFTSGGTEANNLAILGTGMLRRTGHIIISAMEHPSVINPVKHLEACGFEVSYIDPDGEGIVRLEDLIRAIRKNTILISIMHSNNETGVMQPIEDVGKLARKHGIIFHVDAAQSIGKSPFTLINASIDLLTVVPHKFYGPKGIAGLYVRSGVKLSPLLFGGRHEMGLRPGTENVQGIAGFAKACQITMRDLDLRISHTRRLTEVLFERLSLGIPDIFLNGHHTQRLPNTLNVRIPGINSDDLVSRIHDQVAISSGSACHSDKRIPSRTLTSMGLSVQQALCSVRLSVGKDNTEYEIEKASEIIVQAVEVLRNKTEMRPLPQSE